ncbi:protein kinase domain-containing protein, partial [Haematococcus lacustris]
MGSAVDAHSLGEAMFGAQGPSAEEVTWDYAPPEALFAKFWEGSRALRPWMWAYDSWSVAVVWLELL